MANDINTVALSGRLTRDAELKFTNGGAAICKFAIASNYSRKNRDQWEEKANFFDCVMFGKRAEKLQQYLTKGKLLFLQCEARQNRWQNQEGQNRSKVEFVVSSLSFGGGNSGGHSPAADPEADFNADIDDGDFKDDVPF